jgi:hypothetical protein
MQRLQITACHMVKEFMYRLFFCFVLLFFIEGCERDSQIINEKSNGITGKWKLVLYSFSIGGPQEWFVPNPFNTSYIEFKTDGSLQYTPTVQDAATRYLIQSDSTMILFRDSSEFNFRYKHEENKLTLYGPCIEGCADIYERVN